MRYLDVAAMLDNGLPEPPAPVLLKRTDGHALFYAGQLNLLYGLPESGKTLVAQAATVEALREGRRVGFIDIDHNGPAATVCRLLDMGAPEKALRDPDLFRYIEPEDKAQVIAVVRDMKAWRPAVVVVDSVGELMPLFGLNSNSPDDFTIAHSSVLKPLAMAGAAVLAIDHLPKNTDNHSNGPTGTAAKRRAVGGVMLRVTVGTPFAPGKGGTAYLVVNKDRHGGLRRNCPTDGKEPAAGVFTIAASEDSIPWRVVAPRAGDTDAAVAQQRNVPAGDVAALDTLEPPPESVRDVMTRLRWGSNRATAALGAWRSRSPSVTEEQGTES